MGVILLSHVYPVEHHQVLQLLLLLLLLLWSAEYNMVLSRWKKSFCGGWDPDMERVVQHSAHPVYSIHPIYLKGAHVEIMSTLI